MIAGMTSSLRSTSASSTIQTSVSCVSSHAVATSSASRDFPTPPGPTSVTSRCSSIRRRSESRSASRPMSLLSGVRTFVFARAKLTSSRRIAVSSARSSADGSSPSSSRSTRRAILVRA